MMVTLMAEVVAAMFVLVPVIGLRFSMLLLVSDITVIKCHILVFCAHREQPMLQNLFFLLKRLCKTNRFLYFVLCAGGRGRGRGYQTDAPRGRFGARSLGRGGNQDGGGDYSRARGSGFYQRALQ